MHTSQKVVPGGERLSNEEARKRFLRTTQGDRAVQHHDARIGAHALRESQRLAGKLPPVFPHVQTIGCSPSQKFPKR